MNDNVTCPRCDGRHSDPEPMAVCCGNTNNRLQSCCGNPVLSERPCLVCEGLGTLPLNEAFDYALTGEL